MLSGWNWFVDPGGSGNRIWIAWDGTEISVDILETHEQYVHCCVHSLCLHVCSLVTFAYGVHDVYPRQVLWNQLVELLDGVGDDPWIVLGDFNTVLDSSEICGPTSDAHTGMDDFASFLNDTVLWGYRLGVRYSLGTIVPTHLEAFGRSLIAYSSMTDGYYHGRIPLASMPLLGRRFTHR
ncbi:UNVERIFIED_CONTAM: hypothetical protein Sradi_6881200 [Sesamum radiatum]|uniref:Endonuclease/exonuclease/phosphatase domain-containing protein n=1 Tax=Sesamum radiatum TaxID=300843 RepID=A0AAW2JJE9_SESRA